MQKTQFNFAFVLMIVVLLVFSYITFLGLVFWHGGKILSPSLLSISLVVIVIGCVYMMCLGKASRRYKMGIAGQVLFGILVLVALLFASVPFTNFLRVSENEELIREKVSGTYESVNNIDAEYQEYASKRLEDYRATLNLICRGKNIEAHRYEEIIQPAGGENDSAKVAGLIHSLERQILPENLNEEVRLRHEWLEKAKETSVWNPLLAQNIENVSGKVDGWIANYRDISSKKFKGETVECFQPADINEQLAGIMKEYQAFRLPSIMVIVITLLCFLFMMLPWLITPRDTAHQDSGKPLVS